MILGKKKARNNIFSVFGGPSKDELFDAMKYQYDDNFHAEIAFMFGSMFPITFDSVQYYPDSIIATKNIVIDEIKYMNSSGYKLLIKGRMHAKMVLSYELYSFDAIYNTDDRTGSIRLIKF